MDTMEVDGVKRFKTEEELGPAVFARQRDALERQYCIVCQGPTRSVMLEICACEHHACTPCLIGLSVKKCPHCQGDFQATTPNKCHDHVLSSIHVVMVCDKESTLADVDGHIEDCTTCLGVACAKAKASEKLKHTKLIATESQLEESRAMVRSHEEAGKEYRETIADLRERIESMKQMSESNRLSKEQLQKTVLMREEKIRSLKEKRRVEREFLEERVKALESRVRGPDPEKSTPAADTGTADTGTADTGTDLGGTDLGGGGSIDGGKRKDRHTACTSCERAGVSCVVKNNCHSCTYCSIKKTRCSLNVSSKSRRTSSPCATPSAETA